MSFFKRAFLAVTRKKGRTAILFIIFFAIANLVMAGFSIENAAKEAGKLARQKLGGTLTLQFDTQKAMEEARAAAGENSSTGEESRKAMFNIEVEPVTEEMAAAVAGLEHITGYNLTSSVSAMAVDFEAVETSSEDDSGSSNGSPNPNGGEMRPEGSDSPSFEMPDVTLKGVASSEADEYFVNGDYTLSEGEHLSVAEGDSGVAIIEQTLADYNGLEVGDTITVSPQGVDSEYTLTIIGIFKAESASASTSGGFMMGMNQYYNQIYTDYKTVLAMKDEIAATEESEDSTASAMRKFGFSTTPGIDSAVFYVDDPANIDAVLEAAAGIDSIDWDTFTLDADDAAYEQMMKPIENVASFSSMLVVVVAIAGAAILALVLMLWIRERSYETGVLLSVGESKGKVLLQYVCEVLLVAVLAFAVSTFSGGVVSQKVGDYLISAETSVTQSYQQNGMGAGGFGRQPGGLMAGAAAGAATQTVTELDVSVTPDVVVKLFALGLAIIIGATAIPAIMVMRYNPKTILTKA